MSSSREVYLDACSSIADAFVADGFKFAKSGPRMRRKVDGATDEIAFQSSFRNTPDYIVIRVHVHFYAPALAKFRKANKSPFGDSDFLTGYGLNYVGPKKSWDTLNLAKDPQRVVEGVIADIRDVAFPFFSLLRDTDALVASLLKRDHYGILPGNPDAVAGVVEYLLALGRPNDAQAVFSAWCKRNKKVVMTKERDGYAEEARKVAKKYRLTLG